MNILVVGGAGYIGSHTVRILKRAGHKVVVLDNLSTGFKAAVDNRLIVGDMRDRGLVEAILREHEIDSVMHFAAVRVGRRIGWRASQVLPKQRHRDSRITGSDACV